MERMDAVFSDRGQRTDLRQTTERDVAKHRHGEERFDQRVDHVGFKYVTQWNPAEKAQQCFQRDQKQWWMARFILNGDTMPSSRLLLPPTTTYSQS